MSKIFDPYFTSKPAASGLGLAISYSIVKKHGGLLQLESTSPEGSTFAFFLPAAPASAPAPAMQMPVDGDWQPVSTIDELHAVRGYQSRDAQAIHLKLDEIIKSIDQAQN